MKGKQEFVEWLVGRCYLHRQMEVGSEKVTDKEVEAYMKAAEVSYDELVLKNRVPMLKVAWKQERPGVEI